MYAIATTHWSLFDCAYTDFGLGELFLSGALFEERCQILVGFGKRTAAHAIPWLPLASLVQTLTLNG